MKRHVSLPLAISATNDEPLGERRSAIADYAYWTAIWRVFPMFAGISELPRAKPRR